MSTVGIFVMGAIVTALVGGALWLLVWGAVMDGRDNEPEPALEPRPIDVVSERVRPKPLFGPR